MHERPAKLCKAKNRYNSKGKTDKCTNVVENLKTPPQQLMDYLGRKAARV